MKRFILGAITLLATAAASASVNIGFVSQPGDWVGQGETRDYNLDNATFRYEVRPDRSRFSLSLDTLDRNEWWYLTLDGPDGQPLTVGRYTDASRYPFNSATTNGISLSGTGRGCNRIAGEFTIHAIEYDEVGVLEHLDATFIQHCETTMPPLRGYVLIDKRPIEPPVPLTVAIELDDEGVVTRQGVATLSGEVACSGASEAEITGVISQRRRQGTFSTVVPCSETPTVWQAQVSGLKKGAADVESTAVVNRDGETATTTLSKSVRLRR